jgi:hypothetical protein
VILNTKEKDETLKTIDLNNGKVIAQRKLDGTSAKNGQVNLWDEWMIFDLSNLLRFELI